MLADARRKAAPWAEHFSDPDRIEETLRRAQLREIRIEQRSYRVPTTIDDYLAAARPPRLGRFLRNMLGEALWSDSGPAWPRSSGPGSVNRSVTPTTC